MEAPAGKHKQQRFRWLIAAWPLVLFGYPLSIGPVVWLFNRSHVPESLWSAFDCGYRPLIWLVNDGGWAGEPMRAYLRLWIGP